MVNYRNMAITNENGTEVFDLNEFGNYIMTSPTGLGIYRASEYIVVGNQRVRADNKATFQKITFNVLIMGERNDWENKYAQFRDFISRNIKNGFRLYYTPFEETRYIKCDINIVDKTEKDRANLPIKIEVQPLSLWLSDVVKESIQQESDDFNMFIFAENDYDEYSAVFDEVDDLEDDYERQVYAISFGASASQTATIVNSGFEPTPLNIRIYGVAVNPYVALKRYDNGEVVQSVKFSDLTIPDGYYLEINADATDTHIELVNISTGERFDKEDYADIDTNMYLTLPVGRFNITITDEGTDNKCFAEILYANQYYGG